jgi:hypothetical protein
MLQYKARGAYSIVSTYSFPNHSELPQPEDWVFSRDDPGQTYFIDHNQRAFLQWRQVDIQSTLVLDTFRTVMNDNIGSCVLSNNSCTVQ